MFINREGINRFGRSISGILLRKKTLWRSAQHPLSGMKDVFPTCYECCWLRQPLAVSPVLGGKGELGGLKHTVMPKASPSSQRSSPCLMPDQPRGWSECATTGGHSDRPSSSRASPSGGNFTTEPPMRSWWRHCQKLLLGSAEAGVGAASQPHFSLCSILLLSPPFQSYRSKSSP